MSVADGAVWYPTRSDIDKAHVTAIARAIGVDGFDDLYRYSVEQPSEYWAQLMKWLGIKWQKPYSSYVDLGQGNAFPRWFPDGALNWTQSIFDRPDDQERDARAAIIAESEQGEVRRVTYAQLRREVAAFAAGLRNRGIRSGDRVGLLMESSVEAVVSFLAISWIGAIAVPLFSGFGADAIVSRLAGCNARCLIFSAAFRRRGEAILSSEVVREAVGSLPDLDLLVVKGAGEADAKAVDGCVDWHEIPLDTEQCETEIVSANDPFLIVYTSGTTGNPKGTVHTHGGFPIKIVHDAAVYFDLGPGDVWFWPADIGWVAGPITICGALMRGATLICYDGAPNFPDWGRLGNILRDHGVTHFGASPTLIRALASHAESLGEPGGTAVRLLITAGEVIDPESFIWFGNHFNGSPVINFTGGSEVSGGLLGNVVVKPIFPAAFNAAAPTVRLRVLDEEGVPVIDQIGELAICEPFVGMTSSFWKDPERYLETYWTKVPGVWVHGDLAIQRGVHDFVLCGRSDDTLKIAGKRMGPSEIEDIVIGIPGVLEVAAVGIKDAVKGERLVVFLVRAAGTSDVDINQAIVSTVEAKLGKAFRPSVVHYVDELPKTRSGKLMRRLVKRAYEGVTLGDTASLENPSSLEPIRRAYQAFSQ